MRFVAGAVFPPQELLVKFFARRVAPSIAEACILLDWPETKLRRRVMEESFLLPGDHVPWADVALWLIAAWDIEPITAAIGTWPCALPRLLVPRSVHWRVPQYLLAAFHVQLEREQRLRDTHGTSVGNYIASRLHELIDDEAEVVLLRDDGLRRAYLFPHDEEGE